MPLVSIEGASKLEVSAMVSETDITSIKKRNACQHFSENHQNLGKVSEVSLSAKTRVDNIW
jgi:hypothetical protein